MKTNLERIQEYAKTKNDTTLTIHPIPKSSLWLVGQKPFKSSWRIYLCNPNNTRNCLVSKTTSETEYFEIWNRLIQTPIPPKLSEAITEARKCITLYKLSKKTKYVVRKNNKRGKVSSS